MQPRPKSAATSVSAMSAVAKSSHSQVLARKKKFEKKIPLYHWKHHEQSQPGYSSAGLLAMYLVSFDT